MILNCDLEKVLKHALRNGGDFAEIYAEEIESLQSIAENKKIEKINPIFDRGVGIRILLEDFTAYGFTNDLSEKGLLTLAESVSENIKKGLSSKKNIIDLTQRTPHLSMSPLRSPSDLKISDKKNLIDRAEKSA